MFKVGVQGINGFWHAVGCDISPSVREFKDRLEVFFYGRYGMYARARGSKDRPRNSLQLDQVQHKSWWGHGNDYLQLFLNVGVHGIEGFIFLLECGSFCWNVGVQNF